MSKLEQSEALWHKLCFNRKYAPTGRLASYRGLIFHGMLEVVQNLCPVAREILSEADWQELFWSFLEGAALHSPILRHVPAAFSAYLSQSQHPLLERYPYLPELIDYEYLEIEVRFAPEGLTKPESRADNVLALNPSAILRHYRWPVHYICTDYQDAAQMPQGDFYLLLWRAGLDLNVEFMELNLLVAELIALVQSEAMPAAELLKKLAEKQNLPYSAEFQQEGKKLLENLEQRRVLLAKA